MPGSHHPACTSAARVRGGASHSHVLSAQAAFLLQRCFYQPCLSTQSFPLIIPIDNKIFQVILSEI